jgi:hypothetical protein
MADERPDFDKIVFNANETLEDARLAERAAEQRYQRTGSKKDLDAANEASANRRTAQANKKTAQRSRRDTRSRGQ